MVYPLPPGLGVFPLRHLDDFEARLPDAWRRRGGVLLPMHQAEALWINFGSRYGAYQPVRDGMVLESPAADMGLTPGGRMKQEIYDDPYGLDAWDQRHPSRRFVTIINSAQWMAITGERPPTSRPAARSYTEAGLPWFDYYGGDVAAVDGAEKFQGIASVAKIAEQKGTDDQSAPCHRSGQRWREASSGSPLGRMKPRLSGVFPHEDVHVCHEGIPYLCGL